MALVRRMINNTFTLLMLHFKSSAASWIRLEYGPLNVITAQKHFLLNQYNYFKSII